MKKTLVLLTAFFAFTQIASAQVPEPFGTKCDPAMNPEMYQVLTDWYNNNKYDEEEVADVTAKTLKKSIVTERFVASFFDGTEYEIYQFSFPMGEEEIGVTLTVDTKDCATDESYISQYK